MLNNINNKDATLTIDGCMSGYGDDSIAESIANQVGTTVKAPNVFINPNMDKGEFISATTDESNAIGGLLNNLFNIDANFVTF